MRICQSQPAGVWDKHPGRITAGVIPLEWRQVWFTDLCLAVILTAIVALMMLSIFLVFSKPEPPVSLPGPNRTGQYSGGSAFTLAPDLEETPDIQLTFTKWEGYPEGGLIENIS